MDFFKDIDDIRNSFHTFAKLLPDDGTLIINGEISHLEEILEGLDCNVIIYRLCTRKMRFQRQRDYP